MPARKGKKRLNNKEGYDSRNLREYIATRFVFTGDGVGKNVLLIEFDQKYSDKGFSTFIFTSEDAIGYEQEKDFLRKYASNVSLDNIENIFAGQGVRFIRKKHPDKSNKDKSFKAWCGDLYKKL